MTEQTQPEEQQEEATQSEQEEQEEQEAQPEEELSPAQQEFAERARHNERTGGGEVREGELQEQHDEHNRITAGEAA